MEGAEALPLLHAELPASPSRIVLLHLDSLCCLPGLEQVFANFSGNISLVVSSDRFAGIAGFGRQLRANLLHSGLAMTLALGFDIVALRIAALFAPAMRLPVRGWARAAGSRYRPLCTLLEHARQGSAPYVVCQDINAPAILARIRELKPDLVISFHFDQILRPAFLEAAGCPVVNVHPALLPAHRGPCPAFWTLAAGDTRCGVTVHRILDAAIDAGPVLSRWAQPVPADVCMGELDEVLYLEGARSLVSLRGAPDTTLAVPGSPPAYESFPDRRAVREARRRGVRLWRLAHAVRLILAMFGVRPAGR